MTRFRNKYVLNFFIKLREKSVIYYTYLFNHVRDQLNFEARVNVFDVKKILKINNYPIYPCLDAFEYQSRNLFYILYKNIRLIWRKRYLDKFVNIYWFDWFIEFFRNRKYGNNNKKKRRFFKISVFQSLLKEKPLIYYTYPSNHVHDKHSEARVNVSPYSCMYAHILPIEKKPWE